MADKHKQTISCNHRQSIIKKNTAVEFSPVDRVFAWNSCPVLDRTNLKPVRNTFIYITQSSAPSSHRVSPPPYREKSWRLESDMFISPALMTELNFSLSSRVYSENALAQSYNSTQTEMLNTVKSKSDDQSNNKTNKPLACWNQRVYSPPSASAEFCPGRPQPGRSCSTSPRSDGGKDTSASSDISSWTYL